MAKEAKKIEPAAPDAGQKPAGRMLSVKASVPRRFRAGREFGKDPVIIDPAELSEGELRVILSDPYLGTSEVRAKAAPAEDATDT